MRKKESGIVYENRQNQDETLKSAIDDILSAEESAAATVENARETVKSLRTDSAAREKALEESVAAFIAAERSKAMESAVERAEKEKAELIARAEEAGARLVIEKRKIIEKLIDELYSSLGE